jgi:transposase
MRYLDETPVGELRGTLDNVDGKRSTQRLLAAIACRNGVTQTELTGWYDVQWRTIYGWLKRLDIDQSPAQVASNRLC